MGRQGEPGALLDYTFGCLALDKMGESGPLRSLESVLTLTFALRCELHRSLSREFEGGICINIVVRAFNDESFSLDW